MAITRLAIVDGPLGAEHCSPLALVDEAYGAAASFLGTVRNEHHGKGVERLVYEAHRPLAESVLATIAEGLCRRADDQIALAITHGTGRMLPCEVSVAIHVCTPHRGLAFDCCRAALEWIKRDLPVWKKEFYDDGSSAWLYGS